MCSQIPLQDVIQMANDFIISQHLSDSVMRFYQRGMSAIEQYFSEQNLDFYSEETSFRFVLESRQQYESGIICKNHFQYIRRLHEMMRMAASDGRIIYFDLPYWKTQDPSEPFKTVMYEYLNSQKDKGYSDLTIRGERSILRKFLLWIEQSGITSFSEISPDVVESYLPVLQESYPSGPKSALWSLRNFLRFCSEQQKTVPNLYAVLNVKAATKTKIKSGFTNEETKRILQAVDTTTILGKRNYAMLVLTIHTGLRQIDVLNLKLTDIHWREAELHIVQRKTNRQLVLPLDQETGDALADYILNARPKVDTGYVFLRTVPPYKNLRIGSCIGSRMVQKYADIADVSWKREDRKGFHSFRRALGREMLENEVPLHTISEVLVMLIRILQNLIYQLI